MKNNTLVGYITDNFDVIVDQFDIDHDCVGYDCKNHAYIIGSVLNVQGQPTSKILQAFKAGIKDMNQFGPMSDIEIIMTGKHLLSDGWIYDRYPINMKSILYAVIIDGLGYREIRLFYNDKSCGTYHYTLGTIDEYNDDLQNLIDCGVTLKYATS